MIEHHIIKTKNYAFISIRQSPMLEEFLSAARIFVQDPDYSATLNRICDFSQADISHINSIELMTFVEFAKTNIPMAEETKVALVAPTADRSGVLTSFADDIRVGNFRLFYDPQEAVAWINH